MRECDRALECDCSGDLAMEGARGPARHSAVARLRDQKGAVQREGEGDRGVQLVGAVSSALAHGSRKEGNARRRGGHGGNAATNLPAPRLHEPRHAVGEQIRRLDSSNLYDLKDSPTKPQCDMAITATCYNTAGVQAWELCALVACLGLRDIELQGAYRPSRGRDTANVEEPPRRGGGERAAQSVKDVRQTRRGVEGAAVHGHQSWRLRRRRWYPWGVHLADTKGSVAIPLPIRNCVRPRRPRISATEPRAPRSQLPLPRRKEIRLREQRGNGGGLQCAMGDASPGELV